MLVVVRVDRVRDKHLDRPCRIAVQAVHQDGVERRSLVEDVGLADRAVYIDLCGALVAVCAARLRLACRAGRESGWSAGRA